MQGARRPVAHCKAGLLLRLSLQPPQGMMSARPVTEFAGTCKQAATPQEEIKMISCCHRCRHEAVPGQAWQIKTGTLHLEDRLHQRLPINHKVAATAHDPPARARPAAATAAAAGGSATWPWRLVRCGEQGDTLPCLQYSFNT